MAIAQERLHFIKTKKINSLLMKLDLHKAYDCVDWDFLRAVLHKIFLSRLVFEWIMACITDRDLCRNTTEYKYNHKYKDAVEI